MKKYERVPPEERCYIRMKLDLLFTLMSHIVKLQPWVREILLSLNDDIAAVREENMILTDIEINSLCNSMKKVVSIANDTLKAKNVNGMAEAVCRTSLHLEDAKLLSRSLNEIDEMKLWHAVALYVIWQNDQPIYNSRQLPYEPQDVQKVVGFTGDLLCHRQINLRAVQD